MSTSFERSAAERLLPPPAARHAPPPPRPRVVIIDDSPEMVALLRDVLADDYQIVSPADTVTITNIEAEEPDVILVGTPHATSPAALTSHEFAWLAARHERLHRVPVVVLTADPHVLADAGRLAELPGVTMVPLPFEVETLRCVLKSVAREAVARARLGL